MITDNRKLREAKVRKTSQHFSMRGQFKEVRNRDKRKNKKGKEVDERNDRQIEDQEHNIKIGRCFE